MQIIFAIGAICMAFVSIWGQTLLLIMMILALVINIPAYQATIGQRSAMYFHEIVIAAGVIPWFIRQRALQIKTVFPNIWIHLTILTVYASLSTGLGFLRLGEGIDEVVVRAFLAGLRFASMGLAFLIPSAIPTEQDEFGRHMRLMWVGLVVLLAISVLHALSVVNLPSYYGHDMARGTIQYGILWLNRASLGTMAQLGVFVCLLLMRMKKLPLVIGIPTTIGFIWLLLGSFSRSNLVSFVVFIALSVLLAKQKKVTNLLLAIILGGCFVAIASQIPAISERIITLTGTSEVEQALGKSGRLVGWTVAVKYLATHPLNAMVGVGYDCWGRTIYQAGGQSAGHNMYLHVLGELGVVGAFLFFSFFLRLLHRFFRAFHAHGDASLVGGLSLALLLSLLVGSITAELIFPTVTQIVCIETFMLIMGMSMSRLNHPSAWESSPKARSHAVSTEIGT